MKTSKITHHIRFMRRYGHFEESAKHYALARIDWSEPTGGGGVCTEKQLFENPFLIFAWLKKEAIIFDDDRFTKCSNWMKGATQTQRVWINRVKAMKLF